MYKVRYSVLKKWLKELIYKDWILVTSRTRELVFLSSNCPSLVFYGHDSTIYTFGHGTLESI